MLTQNCYIYKVHIYLDIMMDSTSNWPLYFVLLFIILGGCSYIISCVVIYKLYTVNWWAG